MRHLKYVIYVAVVEVLQCVARFQYNCHNGCKKLEVQTQETIHVACGNDFLWGNEQFSDQAWQLLLR